MALGLPDSLLISSFRLLAWQMSTASYLTFLAVRYWKISFCCCFTLGKKLNISKLEKKEVTQLECEIALPDWKSNAAVWNSYLSWATGTAEVDLQRHPGRQATSKWAFLQDTAVVRAGEQVYAAVTPHYSAHLLATPILSIVLSFPQQHGTHCSSPVVTVHNCPFPHNSSLLPNSYTPHFVQHTCLRQCYKLF